MHWLPLALISFLLWGVWAFLGKVLLPHVAWPQLLLWGSLAGVLISSLALRLTGTPLTLDATQIGSGLLVGTLVQLGTIAFWLALSRGGPAATVVPVTAAYPVLAVLLTVIFLQEPLTPTRAAALALFLLAALLATR